MSHPALLLPSLALLLLFTSSAATAASTKCAADKPFGSKVFLVTGASSGIGSVIATQLAKDGAHVVLTARRVDKLEKVAAGIRALGGVATVKKMDVLDYPSVEEVVNTTVKEHGRLDGAFNNAGGGGMPMTVGEADLAEWKRVFELNLYGTLNCMRAEIAVMKAQGGGAIVNNLSMLKSKVMQQQSHYAASKRAILAVQEHAAIEHASDGIRVNSVSPGFTLPSEALDAFISAVPGIKKKMETPQGRLIDTEQDVYPSVALLLDDVRGRSLNGVDIPVSGGMSADEFSLGL